MIEGLFPIDKWDFKSSSILEDLPEDEMGMLSAQMQDTTLPAGTLVFREGTYPKGIYFIREGKVKKFKSDKEGREQIIYIAKAGEIIGYHALLAAERYPDSVATLERSRIAFIPRDVFLEMLYASRELAYRLLKLLSHEFTVLTNTISLFGLHSVRERFAMQLIVLREKYKHNFVPGMQVEINLSREDLANLVGTTRENITRMLRDFKIEGILETRGRKVIILDVIKLIHIVNH